MEYEPSPGRNGRNWWYSGSRAGLPSRPHRESQRCIASSLEEAMSDLFLLLKSFVQDNDDKSRELLRCGGVDVIEQLIKSDRKGPLFRAIQSQSWLAQSLVHSLLELRSACSHYVGLETKVFSRLLFNIPLWLAQPTIKDLVHHSSNQHKYQITSVHSRKACSAFSR